MGRILSRIGVGLTLLLAACGGKVGSEGVEGTDPDSGLTDSGIEPDGGPIDAPPGSCGTGRCSPGLACSPDGCNTCRCMDDGSWACTDMACVDAEPPPPPPECPPSPPSGGCTGEGMTCTYPNGCGGKIVAQCVKGAWIGRADPCAGGCPGAQPSVGSYCNVDGKCYYANGCGGTNTAWCTFNRWNVTVVPCTEPACPPTQPVEFSACSGGIKCAYSNGCGGTNTAWCDGKRWNLATGPCTAPTCPPSLPKAGTGCVGPNKCSYPSPCSSVMTYDTAACDPALGTWQIYYGTCTPPPPPPTCPTARPASGSACTSGTSCQWDSGCGSILYGYCSSGGWSFKDPGCAPGCPASKPASGAACKPGTATSCSYMVPGSSSCTSQCFCADDGRWACLTPPCAG